jgi:hypothetical protein
VEGFGPSLSHALAGFPLTEDELFARIEMQYNLCKEKVFSSGDNPLNKLQHALRHTHPADLQIIKQ